MINYDLPARIKGYISNKYLYDMDETKTGATACEIIGFSTYAGHAITLIVMLEDGSVFWYLPFNAFNVYEYSNTTSLDLQSLIYHNCPEGKCSVTKLNNLPTEVSVFIRNGIGRGWWKGEYLATIDWYEGNDLLNLVLLDNGQLAALPNHKLKFGERATQSFKDYKKLHATWKV